MPSVKRPVGINMTNKEIVDTFVEKMLLKGDLETLGDVLHPDVMINSLTGIRGRGLEVARRAVQVWRDAFPQVDNQLRTSFENETHVMHQWRTIAVQKNVFLGVMPSSETRVFTGVTIYRVHDGKIVEVTGYTDFLVNYSS